MGLYNVKNYNFKSHGCDEMAWFDVPFAIKEYLQNTQGQILKALEVRKWRDWERLDLSGDSVENFERQQRTKTRLIKSDPCLFAGDQGKAIAGSKLCQPRYVLEATVPIEEIRGTPRDHDLRVVIVLWGFRNGPTGCDEATALTVYNNYLDVHAKFSHFVHDGSSTSKESPWAVGLKGKGFILSTSYLAQNTVLQRRLRFCKGEYSKTNPRVLKVKKEDLRALTVTEFRQENPKGKRKDAESDDESDSEAEYSSLTHRTSSHKGDDFYLDRLRKTYKKRGELHLAEKSKQQNQTSISHPSQEHPLVQDDDVCIHVIGLPASLTAEEAFSAVFGFFEERKVWKIPGTLFEVFQGKNKFYHRDQMVPIDSPLDNLSVNYHGELRLSSGRMEIITHGREFDDYRARLAEALDTAVSKIPNLLF
ncbi:hypothetical protein GJ744_002806 [Endocarpon pusillum]|uniref:Uncharacterized protein n=1 Tax=Endocarpon pusillum TaxID=364733 RepID=A0A8H7AMX0_9EURO|nr:hypothetical protein GJ744_002806 [Endocarpon pusillum]